MSAHSPLTYLDLRKSENPQLVIVLLHGLGSDGNDLAPICESINFGCSVRCILPHAPIIPVTINQSMHMRAWYDVVPLSEKDQVSWAGSVALFPDKNWIESESDIRTSQILIMNLIQKLESEGTPADRIVLMGFSQGCAMTLHVGLRYPRKLAGLVALSGYVPLASTVFSERSPAYAAETLPIFMSHGDQDSVVLPSWAKSSKRFLEEFGYTVNWHEYSMGHEISSPLLKDLGKWFTSALHLN